MNKQELLENYTMEQLADMVIEKYNREKSEERPYGAHYDLEDGKAIRFIGFERKEAEPLFALICDRITEKPVSLYPSDKLLQEVDEIKSLKEQLQRKEKEINELKIKITEYQEMSEAHKAESYFAIVENNKLKDQLQHKETIINQIDDILKDLFGVTFEICETKEDFEGFKRCLEKNIKTSTIADFLPTETIKVADMLISASLATGGIILDGKAIKEFSEKLFNISELRQIAEHLLVYCNANVEGKE